MSKMSREAKKAKKAKMCHNTNQNCGDKDCSN